MNKEGKAKKIIPVEERLPVGRFFAWKARDISMAAVAIIMGYFTMFCTDFLNMPAALVGSLLLVSKIFDGVTDMVAGFLIDNTKTKWGRGRPYEICAIGVWLCTILLFCCPAGWGTTVKAIWIFTAYTFQFSVFNTLIGSAQTPYMVRAFPNEQQVAKVCSYGGIVTMLGSMVVSLSFPLVMARIATTDAGWRALILIYGIPLALLGTLRFIFVKEDPSVDAETQGKKVRFKEIITMFKTNKYAWYYGLIMGMYNLTLGLSVVAYYFKYVVGNQGAQGLLSAVSFTLLPVMFIFPKLMKKLGVSKMIAVGALLSAAGYMLAFFAKGSMPMLLVCAVLYGMAAFPIAYLGSVVIMNLATYNEYKGLPRMEGSVNIISGFFTKVFAGLGTALLGILLGAAGYVSQDGVAQPDSAIMMIRLLYSVIPAFCFILIAFLAFKLSVLDKQLPDIEQAIRGGKKVLEKDS